LKDKLEKQLERNRKNIQKQVLDDLAKHMQNIGFDTYIVDKDHPEGSKLNKENKDEMDKK
jgi:uncharacterized protein (DUF934 family)